MMSLKGLAYYMSARSAAWTHSEERAGYNVSKFVRWVEGGRQRTRRVTLMLSRPRVEACSSATYHCMVAIVAACCCVCLMLNVIEVAAVC